MGEIIEPEILDDSWITQFKNAENDYNDFYKETPISVKLYFMYVNGDKIIELVKTEQFLLNNEGKIEKEHLITIIKKQETFYNIKYKLTSLLKFNIDIDPRDIISNAYLQQINNKYLSVEQYIQDIKFQDTVCVFQNVNSLFFIFEERNENNNKQKCYTNTRKILFNTKYRKTIKKRV